MPPAPARLPGSWSIDAATRARRAAPWLVLVAASFAFRAPPLLNAWDTNSDAAVVGLQAMHLLRGEWSPFLWGSGYQTSVDASVAALFFAFAGATPRALMLSALTLHVALTCLAYDLLRRRTSRWTALLLALPLVFTPSPSMTYILYPPRQASLTLAIAAAWLLDRAADAAPRARARRLAAGAMTAALACFADPYALVLVPSLAVLAIAGALAAPSIVAKGRAAASIAIGGAVGAVPLLLLWSSPRASHGQVGLTAAVVRHNAALLVDPCLPWALGMRAWFARHALAYAPWEPPAIVRAAMIAAGASLLALAFVGGALAFARRITPAARRLGAAGAVGIAATIGGFLVSVMVMDLFSARYLAAIVLVAPLALAPVAELLGARRFALAIAPYVASAAIAGWVGYGDQVRGAWPVAAVPDPPPERALGDWLAARDVAYATADYWVSYRLTFLLGERVVVVPTNAAEDRYPPYRASFERAPRVAYVFDPRRSREAAGSMEARVRAGETPFARDCEVADVDGLTVLLLRRAGASQAITVHRL